jgi:hypothetical protein
MEMEEKYISLKEMKENKYLDQFTIDEESRAQAFVDLFYFAHIWLETEEDEEVKLPKCKFVCLRDKINKRKEINNPSGWFIDVYVLLSKPKNDSNEE